MVALVICIASSAPGGVGAPSGDSGAQRLEPPRVAGAESSGANGVAQAGQSAGTPEVGGSNPFRLVAPDSHKRDREVYQGPRRNAKKRADRAATSETCRSARKGLAFYRAAYRGWRARMGARLFPPIRSGSLLCPHYLALLWRTKARAARRAYERWYAWNYDWRSWLPANWLAVAICESGHNPPNWKHDSGTYVSAFGIYRPGYRDDAHRIGKLSWDETLRRLKRYPTPRAQYQAALSHYRTHGDGWGCPGP